MQSGSYVPVFNGYIEVAQIFDGQFEQLKLLTVDMRDHEGFQGLFWHSVEANSRPWRQAYALAQVTMISLQTAFLTGALLSTETFLRGTKVKGLLENMSCSNCL